MKKTKHRYFSEHRVSKVTSLGSSRSSGHEDVFGDNGGNPSTSSTATSWSEADDWSQLSLESERIDTSKIYNQDLAWNAAQDYEKDFSGEFEESSEEDVWMTSIVDDIHDNSHYAEGDDGEYISLFDSQFEEDTNTEDESSSGNDLEDMSSEIAMLVRCNENPDDLLISEGRAYAPLTEQEKNDVFQLVQIKDDKLVATEFFRDAVAKIFHQHAVADVMDGVLSLDRRGVSRWMTQALTSEDHGRQVSPHDRRVLQALSDHGSYGSGRLLEEDFQNLYLKTIVGTHPDKKVSWKRHLALRQTFVDAVWRDLRNHGILSPAELERQELLAKAARGPATLSAASTMMQETLMDECQILDWDYSDSSSASSSLSESATKDRQTASKSRSSHHLVEMAPNTKTPLWMKDGEFVFIDEESCIGCMQCVNVSPDSFLMLDSGRARTFEQRRTPDVNQAVASCPVACMHRVTYQELKEYESARDEGDGRDDHRYLGQGRHIPLYVAGIDSDNNRKSSWYHTLKEKCLSSSQCPQKGCYNCPKFSQPGGNPFFQARQKRQNHIRAEYFVDHGDFDPWRKSAEL